jgi:hypothetical protein
MITSYSLNITKEATYETDITNVWWRNFIKAANNWSTRSIEENIIWRDQLLAQYSAVIKEGVIYFENDYNRTLFLLRFS